MIVNKDRLSEICEDLKSVGQILVFTNGCFDILHSGHVKYLSEAKTYGDKLILGLNSDDSVRRLKGDDRPINSQVDRAVVLDALKVVDYVCLFNEDTPLELISAIKPNVLVKGSDYEIDDIVGADIVKKNGGSVITIPLVTGKSTTDLISRIKSM